MLNLSRVQVHNRRNDKYNMKFISKILYVGIFLLVYITLLITGFSIKRDEVNPSENIIQNHVSQHYTTPLDNNTVKFTDTTCRSEIDTSALFPNMKFNASWIEKKYFWHSSDFSFEKRYAAHKTDLVKNQNIVKVIILPHSHNDPGWLNTYDQYYDMQTKLILDNAVEKLTALPAMTFVWSEITYLAKWWKGASALQKQRFKTLVKEGRLEIATGGWVMPDEATSSLYLLIHELTEGQQWVRNNINVKPDFSWAIDPFGHSSTRAHLLQSADMKGMVIQRLHYAWKHWFAEHKAGEFSWRPRWDPSGAHDIPCLTLPYDLYSIKHACGPEPLVCLRFDFRSIPFEYGENYGRMTPISRHNLKNSAQDIATQYHKTASLTLRNHNVVLVPLGDDFRYDRPLEWEQQYANYMQLFSYINSHRDTLRMEIGFGTLRNYFEAVNQIYPESQETRPSLSGDFFPYGDVYVSGQPAYWTGFYGTRPFWKKIHREVENELRSAEILFAYTTALAKQSKRNDEPVQQLYNDLVSARSDFGIFAHHDGITGTSRRWTMEDYGNRLYDAYSKTINLQIRCIRRIHKMTSQNPIPSITKDILKERFDEIGTKIPIEISDNDEYATKITLFNSLGWKRTELVKVIVKSTTVQVTDSAGMHLKSQINPVIIYNQGANGKPDGVVSDRTFELVFLAPLNPLSLSVFYITHNPNTDDNNSRLAKIFCTKCVFSNETLFTATTLQRVQDNLTLQNENVVINFQSNGLIEGVTAKTNKTVHTKLSFGMYQPMNKQSGAYLLKPILSLEYKFFDSPLVIKISGPVMSQVISVHSSRYETIAVNTTLLNLNKDFSSDYLSEGILLENYVDFTRDLSNKVEAYMRMDTDLTSLSTFAQNNITSEQQVPAMYTDQNGFVSEKRINVPSIGYEGNTYPVTTMAYLQDPEKRLRVSLLVDRTHGFCSMENGRLETLIERKSIYDDGRGMSEGVSDSKPTISSYTLLVEWLQVDEPIALDTFSSWQPTSKALQASLRLNYPPNMFVHNEAKADNVEGQDISLITLPLPANVHLLNFRMLSKPSVNNTTTVDRGTQQEILSDAALMNLQYLPDFMSKYGQCENQTMIDNTTLSVEQLENMAQFNGINISSIEPTSLTGVLHKEAQPGSLLFNFKLFF